MLMTGEYERLVTDYQPYVERQVLALLMAMALLATQPYRFQAWS